MRVLILGGNGLLGHKMYQACRERFDTQVGLRKDCFSRLECSLFSPSEVVVVDSWVIEDPRQLIEKTNPGVVINCVGITDKTKSPEEMYQVNSLFPHKLALACSLQGSKLIHISTDCIFSGNQGNYMEYSAPDPVSSYGWSKLLGEINLPNCLTLRTSFIGREIDGKRGLLEWIFSQQGKQVRGYTNARFSGITSNRLAQLIADIIELPFKLEGVYFVGCKTISKFCLLQQIIHQFNLNINLIADREFKCDRSFQSSKFYHRTRFSYPNWPEMLEEIQADPTPYKNWS